MAEQNSQTLILVPDYVTGAINAADAGAVLAGDAAKIPQSYRVGRFIDVNDAGGRQELMLLAGGFSRLEVLWPGAGYCRRLAQMDDRCFFVNLTLRLLAAGCNICIQTGMIRKRLPPLVCDWLAELQRWGIELEYVRENTLASTKGELDLVTAADVMDCAKNGGTEIIAGAKAIITPMAWDEAKDKQIAIRIQK